MGYENPAIRKAARGQACTLMFPGTGLHDRETVVWAHMPGNRYGGGMGTKNHDFVGCFACQNCHDILDGRIKTDFTPEFLQHKFDEAMRISIVRLFEMGVKLW